MVTNNSPSLPFPPISLQSDETLPQIHRMQQRLQLKINQVPHWLHLSRARLISVTQELRETHPRQIRLVDTNRTHNCPTNSTHRNKPATAHLAQPNDNRSLKKKTSKNRNGPLMMVAWRYSSTVRVPLDLISQSSSSNPDQASQTSQTSRPLITGGTQEEERGFGEGVPGDRRNVRVDLLHRVFNQLHWECRNPTRD